MLRLRSRAGMALPASLAAITAVSILMSGLWVIVDLNAKTSTNRKSAMSALLLAEAGVSHGLALLRGDLRNRKLDDLLKGHDAVPGTVDDTLLVGYGLATDRELPPEGTTFGSGTYTVTIHDDPAEIDGIPTTDNNNRVLLRCRGTMPDGAGAEIHAIVGMIPLPAIATEGILKIGGNPRILGPCGGIHANEIIQVSGHPTVAGPITASDTVEASNCAIQKPDGTCNVPLHNQPPVDIPLLTMAQVCINPTLSLNVNGTMIDHVPEPDRFYPNDGIERFGWKYQGSGVWKVASGTMRDGMICSTGDLEMSGSPGSPAAPIKISLYTTRSVSISGNPTLIPFDLDGGLIVAEGDVEIAGNPTSGTHNNYSGMIYAGSQCKVNGSPRLSGQLLCKDLPQNPAHKDYVNISDLNADVSGNPEIVFDCNGSMLGKRKILSWSQKIGS